MELEVKSHEVASLQRVDNSKSQGQVGLESFGLQDQPILRSGINTKHLPCNPTCPGHMGCQHRREKLHQDKGKPLNAEKPLWLL